MYSTEKPRVSLLANRSASLNVIGPNATSAPISGTLVRHSSSNLENSPKSKQRASTSEVTGSPKSRNTGTFTPAQPRFEVSSDMIAVARRSMEINKSPSPTLQRHLPPLPPLPSHATSPRSTPSPTPPASPASSASASPASAPLAPAPLASASPASSASSASLESASLSPRLPPPVPPRLHTSSSFSSVPHVPLMSASAPLSPRLPASALPPSPSPRPTSTPPSPTPAIFPKSDSDRHEPALLSPPNARLVPKKPLPPRPNSSNLILPRYTPSPDSGKDSPTPESPTTDPTAVSLDSQDKKDPKYYSNPEPAITTKDGVLQRHLSAPSSVLNENQLHTPNADGQEIPGGSILARTHSVERPMIITRTPSTEMNGSFVTSGPESPHGSHLRTSTEDSPTTLRSWYLKKHSVQERSASSIPKERPEYRAHLKGLPDIVDISYKNKCIKEIFTTEASYVDDLFVTIKVYKEPMHRYKTVSDEGIVAIFSNIEELYEINKSLLTSMLDLIPSINELAADDTPCPPIGDIFLQHLGQFSGYTTYLCNKDLSSRVVKKVENSAHFASLMLECKQTRDCHGLGLTDFLIKPVQRLCKYPLLFKELQKHLSPDDPQIPLLNQVISEVEKLAEVANKNITTSEKIQEVRKIMGPDVLPLLEGAKMVRDGSVFVVSKTKKEESCFWLFDTLLLWHPMRATLRKVVKSSKLKTAITTSAIISVCEEEHDHFKHSFALQYININGKEKKAVFCAQSYLEKLCWIDDIKAQLGK
eukprot:Phypoly_transcript_03280.p1 GENE.Phypoly_transcript_03280~~Phypoly_transcript_03280.p1  ORF type:complete len:761 (+),score=144.71 Phypoly_transcript_03280:174-2456(+)